MDTERRIKSKIGSQNGGAEVAPSLKIGGGKASIDTTLTAGRQETCNLSHFTTIQSIFCCYSNIEQILNTHSLAATRHCNFCFFPQSLLAAKKDLSLLRFKLRICLLKCSVQIIDIFAGTSAWSDIAPHKPLRAPNSAQSYLASGPRMEDRGEMSGEKISLAR